MTVSAKQNWTGAGTGSNVATQDLILPLAVIAGNVLKVYAERGLGTGTMSIADIIGDSGGAGTAWSSAKVVPNATQPGTIQGWWRVIGNSPSSTNKTITVTNVTDNRALTVFAAEGHSDVGGTTWNLNGTPVGTTGSSTAPKGGSVTVDANPSWASTFSSTNDATSTIAGGYTRESMATFWGADAVGDKFMAASGTEAPTWATSPSAAWSAITFVLEATPAASTIVTRRSTGPRVGSRSYY